MSGETNFDFLKEVDKNLYDIIADAERLYRGEFFQPCMAQTRRFGEHLCRNVLGTSRTDEVTFDEMLSTLKDKVKSVEESEFVDDLYFLKKNGNISAHSGVVTKDGSTALVCLQRAFEAALNYAVYNKKASKKLLDLQYDIELLATGIKSKQPLSQKYKKAKETYNQKLEENIPKKNQVEEKPKKVNKTAQKPKKTDKKTTKNTPKKTKQVTSMNSVPRKTGVSPFWILVGISFVISLFALIFILL